MFAGIAGVGYFTNWPLGLAPFMLSLSGRGIAAERLQVKPTCANCKTGAHPWFCRENAVS
jgi:hypothetical protein